MTAAAAAEGQAEWPTPDRPPGPTGTKTIGHCSTCMAGRPGEDAPVTRVDHISAMADGRFLCFCDPCLTIIARFAPAVTP